MLFEQTCLPEEFLEGEVLNRPPWVEKTEFCVNLASVINFKMAAWFAMAFSVFCADKGHFGCHGDLVD